MEYKNIDMDKVAQIEKLQSSLRYNVLEMKKVCTVSNMDDDSSFAWDMLQENIRYYASELDGVCVVKNYDTRGLCNPVEKKDKSGNTIDFYKLAEQVLTKKEYMFFNDWSIADYIDFIKDGFYYYIGIEQDYEYILSGEYTEKNINILDIILKKIQNEFEYKEIKATGYSQGDCDFYTVAYLISITPEQKYFLEDLINALGYVFTASEISIKLETIEVREYENGDKVENVISEEYENTFNFNGLDSYQDIIKYIKDTYKDYQLVDNL